MPESLRRHRSTTRGLSTGEKRHLSCLRDAATTLAPGISEPNPVLGAAGGGQGREAAVLVALPHASAGPLHAFRTSWGCWMFLPVLGLKFLGEETFKFLLVLDVLWGRPEKALT